MNTQKVKIVSTGIYIPPKVQTSAELSRLIGRSEDWIISRTGVVNRHIAEEPMDAMGAKAAHVALQNGPPPDCIINASTTPLQLIPDSSVFIQKELGLDGIPSWSVQATCLSFVIALNSAAALVQTGVYKRVLIVSSETGTPWRDLNEPESAALFGDGAAAVVIEPAPEGEQSRLCDWVMTTWPKGADSTEFRGAGSRRPPFISDVTRPEDYLFHMKGPKIFRFAIPRAKEALEVLFKRNNLEIKDIDRLILHQASGKAIEQYVHYGFEREKVEKNLDEYGNCISASIPMTLALADRKGRLKRGDNLLIGGTGAGLSVAFALLKW
ncbi:MAG: ketoacyl-ACP synthase III [Chitinispirillaceae bacterium]|nr:ketoacyl-ACP synthase III [Chitinispirillaceae bacterium]